MARTQNIKKTIRTVYIDCHDGGDAAAGAGVPVFAAELFVALASLVALIVVVTCRR